MIVWVRVPIPAPNTNMETDMKNDDLENRMKKYEYVTRTHLVPRCPVIIRLDGKSFHTFTRGFKKPFDKVFLDTMQETMKYLCEHIQGCVLGYTQSDEITLVLIDYMKLNSDSWFDYNIQKCASVSASMATMAFNKIFLQKIELLLARECSGEQYTTYELAAHKGAMFDARAFNIPKEEVCNNILWRQNDAVRNSILSLGLAHFSHSILKDKSCSEIKDLLFKEKGINWNDLKTRFQRGSCCVKRPTNNTSGGVMRMKWFIDNEIPIFKGDGRKYIDDLIFVGE